MQRRTSLYHCTDYKSLCMILSAGYYIPSYCLEEFSILYNNKMNMAYAVVCFADLLVDEVNHHMKTFRSDSYLMMSKKWAIKNNISPVIYYTDKSNMASYLGNIIQYAGKQYVQQNLTGARNVEELKFVNSSQMLLAYLKQYEGRYWMKKEEKFSEITNFYTEREWRYVPMPKNFEAFYIDEEEFMNTQLKKQKQEELVKHDYVVRFKWDDIEEIGIPKWAEGNFWQHINNNAELAADQINSKLHLLEIEL